MKKIKVGSKVIIGDIKNIESKMSYNNEMTSLIGKTAKVVEIYKTAYSDKEYYRINLDMAKNMWVGEWFI
ncbi:hypothetical protein [Terrisporobacter sp.]|uniref:hypothetical protein n=1 Tax=Terrisporobacter sp. TaxID=1965305 RepID=UPI0026220704|nr:hypothetical protein [Terrisporobacter sp.]